MTNSQLIGTCTLSFLTLLFSATFLWAVVNTGDVPVFSTEFKGMGGKAGGLRFSVQFCCAVMVILFASLLCGLIWQQVNDEHDSAEKALARTFELQKAKEADERKYKDAEAARVADLAKQTLCEKK